MCLAVVLQDVCDNTIWVAVLGTDVGNASLNPLVIDYEVLDFFDDSFFQVRVHLLFLSFVVSKQFARAEYLNTDF